MALDCGRRSRFGFRIWIRIVRVGVWKQQAIKGGAMNLNTAMRGLIGMLLLCCLAIAPATAQEQAKEQDKDQDKGFQLALWHPVQIFPSATSIKGVRWNLFYGVNQDVHGLDIGLANNAKGQVRGLQFGLVSLAGKDMDGWQAGWLINRVGGKLTGIQTGITNGAGELHGMQVGLANHVAGQARGLQVGIINHAQEAKTLQIGLLYNSAENLHGVQIGLLNFFWNRKGDIPTFLPIINANF